MPVHRNGEGGSGYVSYKCFGCGKLYKFGVKEPKKEMVERWLETFICKCGYNDKSDFHKMIRGIMKKSKQKNWFK